MLAMTCRSLTATSVAAGFLVSGAGAAAAGVTVTPDAAVRGDHVTLTFNVSEDRDDADTTALEIDFPTDSPLRGVSVLPHPGWSYDVSRTVLPNASPGPAASPAATPGRDMSGMNMPGMHMHGMAAPGAGKEEVHPQPLSSEYVSRITWTTQGAGIRPGQFDQFTINLGPLPTGDSLVFKAVQTYSDGQSVAWQDQAASGAPQPAHPGPAVRLLSARAGGSGTVADYAIGVISAGSGAAGRDGSPASMPGMDMGSNTKPMSGMPMSGMSMGGSPSEASDVAMALGIGGLFAGLLGAILGVGARRRGDAPSGSGHHDH
jgi:uncharacterized protein